MLKNYNSKLGPDIYAFSLPRSTCHHKTIDCEKYCYAKRGTFIFDNVKEALDRYYKESLEDDFVDRLCAQIIFNRVKWVRIHPSGDFYSQEYADKWKEIAKRSPKTKFLVYTRNWDIDFSDVPKNLTVYNSVDKSTKKTNPTIKRRAIAIDITAPKHMKRVKYGFICDNKCRYCKACWYGKFDVVFPIR